MFWGLILKANRKYTQTIKKAFHLSQAALEVDSCDDTPVHLVLTSDKLKYVLCTLRKNTCEQVALDLNFAEGDTISFTSEGTGNVHLSGYLVVDDFDDIEASDEEQETMLVNPNKEKKTKAKKQVEVGDDSDDSSDDEAEAADITGGGDEEEDSDDDEEEEDDGDDSDDSSDEEEEVQEPKHKQQKVEKPKQNGVEKQPKNKKEKKEQKQQQKSQSAEKAKVIQGGVRIEDLVEGSGIEAKPGKKVVVYYEGRLKSNNKVFDSALKGAGFKFHLGRGEVIKGWDIGVAGMKVGGKRRVTCPPHMGYGNKGSPPVIPPNSTLVFDVELKNVN